VHWTLGSLPHFQAFFWLRVFSAPKQSPRSTTAAVNANGWVTSSFSCSQAESTVRYGGSQRKRLATLSSFCSQAESTVRYGGGQRKWLGSLDNKFLALRFLCSQAESTPATAMVNANRWAVDHLKVQHSKL